jgi:hypothetical protein
VPAERYHFSKVAEELIADLRGIPSDAPPRSRLRPTHEMPELMEKLLQKYRIGREAPEHTIREHWASIVGDANASYSHPAKLERNMLYVLAAHAVVRNELFLHRAEIVARIRQLPGCEKVKAINLQPG